MVLTTLAMMSMLAAPPTLPARYLALGDSYTIGESVPADARWPNRLAAALRASGREIGDPQIIARTGWTTDELSAVLDAVERGESVALADGEEAPVQASGHHLDHCAFCGLAGDGAAPWPSPADLFTEPRASSWSAWRRSRRPAGRSPASVGGVGRARSCGPSLARAPRGARR